MAFTAKVVLTARVEQVVHVHEKQTTGEDFSHVLLLESLFPCYAVAADLA